MPFDPKKKSANAFKDPALRGSSFTPSENQVDYKKLKIGDYIDFRILSLSPEDIAVIDQRKVSITNPKNGEYMAVSVEDPGHEAAQTLKDHAGMRLVDCDTAKLFRVPVYVYSVTADKKTEEVNKPMFLEFGMGIKISIDKLEEGQEGACVFDEETGLPNYDVRLKIVAGPSKQYSKNYAIEPIVLKGAKPHPNFDKDLSEALTEDQLEQVDQAWEGLQEEIQKRKTVEEIKRDLTPRGKGASISKKPELGSDDEPEGDEENENEGSDQPEEEEESKPKKYAFGKKKA